MTTSVDLRRFSTPQDLFHAAAEEFVASAKQAIAQRKRFTVALSGGSTPKSLYTLISANASASLPWNQMFFFFGDERHVGPSDADSNYRMAQETLFSKAPIPEANIFRIPAENSKAAQAAAEYERTLQKFFALRAGEMPRFDLILLGMGPDGHTASLFPETAALGETSRLVVANAVAKLKTERITLTLPVLNAARCVTFLVSGMDKAPALHQVLEGDAPPERYPSKLVRPADGKLIWLVDKAAASELSAAA